MQKCIYICVKMRDNVCIYIYILFTYAEFLHLFCILFLRLCDIADSSAAIIASLVPRFYAIPEIK